MCSPDKHTVPFFFFCLHKHFYLEEGGEWCKNNFNEEEKLSVSVVILNYEQIC